jgi:hypothetical protein
MSFIDKLLGPRTVEIQSSTRESLSRDVVNGSFTRSLMRIPPKVRNCVSWESKCSVVEKSYKRITVNRSQEMERLESKGIRTQFEGGISLEKLGTFNYR